METGDMLKEIYSFKSKDLRDVQEKMLDIVDQNDAHERLKQLLTMEVSHTGKLLRPLIELLAAGDYPAEAREELLCAAAAAELLHHASLLHDDIIDSAEIRRGSPSIQARHGIPIAICAGDYLMIAPFSYLNRQGYHETADELMDTALKVCAGECLQDEHQFDISVSEEVYLESVRGKTAASFAACCAIGSRIAGRPEQVQQAMRSFGEIMGIMFQIRDDLLDWNDDNDRLGKPTNEDFVNGIYTIPVIYALRQESCKKDLIKYTTGNKLTESDLSEVCKIVLRSGGITYAQGMIDALARKAFAFLDIIQGDIYYKYFCNLITGLRHDAMKIGQDVE